MSTKYIVDNLSGQTINGDITINGDFTVTGTTNIRPYKVFTALLTQNGTSSTVNATSGLLIVGVSYLIDVYNAGDDFSNVGGPAAGLQGEWDGYSFLATGTTPNNWNNLSGLDYNTGAPVVTVLENTIGNIWFTYADAGIYYINSSDLFTNNKTYTVIQLWGDDSIASRTGFVQRQSSSELLLFNKEYTGEVSINGIGYFDFLTSIEIRVYN
jgi:hypothetical protein